MIGDMSPNKKSIYISMYLFYMQPCSLMDTIRLDIQFFSFFWKLTENAWSKYSYKYINVFEQKQRKHIFCMSHKTPKIIWNNPLPGIIKKLRNREVKRKVYCAAQLVIPLRSWFFKIIIVIFIGWKSTNTLITYTYSSIYIQGIS